MQLCGTCDDVLSHDELIQFVRSEASDVPAELLDSLYQDEMIVGCSASEIEVGEQPVSRLQMLRTLMRSFGYLEPPPPQPTPPCDRIS